MATDREFIAEWWDRAWREGLWSAGWAASLEGVTGAQAAWRPPSATGVSEPRHSICQHVQHMVFWRESWLRRVATGKGTTDQERETLNWPHAGADAELDWAEAKRKLAETQERMSTLLKSSDLSDEQFSRIAHFVPHDCYHFGQINMIRGMLGMKPIE